MDREEIEIYNENISAACFFGGFVEYQDHAGNWRACGDTAPICYVAEPEIVEAEVVEQPIGIYFPIMQG